MEHNVYYACGAEEALGDLARRGERAQLCYLDPPFWTGRDFGAYDDRFSSPNEYYDSMARILQGVKGAISDVRGVDIHMAHAHILSDYNDVLSEDVSAELFNRMAIEIMKAVNFYNYNNRERSLRRIYLCGGGVAVDQIRAAICRVTDLDVHNAEELLPQHDALEAAWLYIKAIGCALQK